jgi:hypothetical protein
MLDRKRRGVMLGVKWKAAQINAEGSHVRSRDRAAPMVPSGPPMIAGSPYSSVVVLLLVLPRLNDVGIGASHTMVPGSYCLKIADALASAAAPTGTSAPSMPTTRSRSK